MTTHNDESLKPCPMCGKSVAVVSTHKEMFCEDEYYDDSNEETFAVFCDASKPHGPGGCGASGGFARTKTEAIERWDTRAQLSAQSVSAVQPVCKTCRGNDADMPCAYPSKGMAGCIRDARLADADAVDAKRGKFLIDNWRFTIDDQPLPLWIGNNAMRLGGIAKAIDAAMAQSTEGAKG